MNKVVRSFLLMAIVVTLVATGVTQSPVKASLPSELSLIDGPTVVVEPGVPLSQRILEMHYKTVSYDIWHARLEERLPFLASDAPYQIRTVLVQGDAKDRDTFVRQLADANLRPATARELIEVANALHATCCTDDEKRTKLLVERLRVKEVRNHGDWVDTRWSFWTPDAKVPLSGAWKDSYAMVQFRIYDHTERLDGRFLSRSEGFHSSLHLVNIFPKDLGPGDFTVKYFYAVAVRH